MKKYHLYLCLAVLTGLLAACSSQDETDVLQTPEKNRVTITATMPADFVQPKSQSRALPSSPDQQHKLRCILEVWDDNLTTLKVRKEITPAAGSAEISFSFELSETGSYKALLWADYISADANPAPATIAGLADVAHYQDAFYKTNSNDGLKAVDINGMSPLTHELRDAFYAFAGFSKGTEALTGLKATLTRPLTKVTVAEKNLTNFGYCQQVTAKYSTFKTLNVATGAVSGTMETVQVLTAGNGDFGKDITIKDTPCKILFANYFFAANNGTMGEIKLEFTTNPASGKVLRPVTIPAGIPAKRNYRINAAGNLTRAENAPSNSVEMTVDINSDWTTPDENLMYPGVGDYYYFDKTFYPTEMPTKTLVGIVFWVDYANRRGLITSLDKNMTGMTWDAAMEWKSSNNLPAGMSWRLPTKNELQYLWCAANGAEPITWETTSPVSKNQEAYLAFCEKLTGGQYGNYFYWSNEEDTGDPGKYWTMNFSKGVTTSLIKSGTYRVFCVSEFEF